MDLCFRAVIFIIVSPVVWISPTPVPSCLPWMQHSKYFTEFPTIIDFFFFSLGRQEYQRGMVWEEFSSYLLESRPCYGISSRDISQWLLILYLCWSHTGIFFRFFTVSISWSSRVRATKLWGIPLIKNSMTHEDSRNLKWGFWSWEKDWLKGQLDPSDVARRKDVTP